MSILDSREFVGGRSDEEIALQHGLDMVEQARTIEDLKPYLSSEYPRVRETAISRLPEVDQ